jgi:hypothetical protein
MGAFSSVLTGSLQGIAERPLPCNYNVIQPVSAFLPLAVVCHLCRVGFPKSIGLQLSLPVVIHQSG